MAATQKTKKNTENIKSAQKTQQSFVTHANTDKNNMDKVYSLVFKKIRSKLGFLRDRYGDDKFEDSYRLMTTITIAKMALLTDHYIGATLLEKCVLNAIKTINELYTDNQIESIGCSIWNIVSDLAVDYAVSYIQTEELDGISNKTNERRDNNEEIRQ